MTQKILIAMDESENSSRAVDFVGNFVKQDADVTLFSVLLNTESLCNMQGPALTPYFAAEQSTFCVLEDKKKELMNEALKKAKQKLVQAGFAENRVQIKTIERKRGVARDIIAEANSSSYNLVVLGRRGLSGIMEFIMGSVSQKVLHGVNKVSVVLAE